MAAEVVVAATEVVRPKSRSGCESHGHFFEVLHVRDPKILIFREKSAKIRGNSVALQFGTCQRTSVKIREKFIIICENCDESLL